jgi:hypothetical protein
MKKNKSAQEQVKVKGESDYIQAEHDLCQALGMNPKKFDKIASAQGSRVVGAWLDDKGNALPAWIRDGGACFCIMAHFQCYPSSGGNDDVFIQTGIDLESVLVRTDEHVSYEIAVRYAVALAAAEMSIMGRRNGIRPINYSGTEVFQ